jgi:hypothetical protein
VCEAELTWEDQKLVVAEKAAQIDLDLFGVNLKDEGPMAAFQVQPSKNKCCSTYQIYSLDKPPRLLRSITGGGTFTATDTDLDGRIEIWAEDAAAVDGFDGLFASEMNYLPTYAVRFEHGQLNDATPEFQDYFDRIVAAIRGQMNPESLRDFKQSDGVLRVGSIPDAARFHRLRLTKVHVLEHRMGVSDQRARTGRVAILAGHVAGERRREGSRGHHQCARRRNLFAD